MDEKLMTISRTLRKILANEDINFLLTNRIPRQSLTLLMGKVSQIQSPAFTKLALKMWSWFDKFDMSEAKADKFQSIHDFFIRELKPGARPIAEDAACLISPCDGIIGAHGEIREGQLFQAKGYDYQLEELIGKEAVARQWLNGKFLTLRIRSSMYHRFHAPCAGRLTQVRYFSGDTWNVNPIALKRVEKLFCKNERAFLLVENHAHNNLIALVPVAAVLVASIRLHAIDTLLHLRYKGPNDIACDATFDRGDEMGWFQHGSTIIMLMPPDYELASGLQTGDSVKMGQNLLRKTG
jgi:phosphatidylserine decarboxylase